MGDRHIFGSMKISRCPNRACVYAKQTEDRFFVKCGYYTTKWNAQPVPRYRCKECKKYFSTHTFLKTWRQKKPYLNRSVYLWYVSTVTQRRMAQVLKTNRKTIVRKFLFMANLAKLAHRQRLRDGSLVTEHAQFDEMESFVHSRLKPVSIALAVSERGEILGVQVASMPSKGKRAALARKKYGYRADRRRRARIKVLTALTRCQSKKTLSVTTDKHPAYPPLVQTILPTATLYQVESRRSKPRSHFIAGYRRNHQDPLFALNFTAAKIRHHLSRMLRRVWVTTKKSTRLQAHLNLYIAYQNGYPLDNFDA